jgi:small-conductance mechanosensitive channel
LLNVWDSFKENEIEIPFPQRDLHLRSSDGTVKIEIPGNATENTVR